MSNGAPGSQKEHKPNIITRVASQWWNRLLGAASEGALDNQEEMYASHRTNRDYMWNTIGAATWGALFPILTIIITQLVGTELAGMFSLAFVTGSLLMIVANYGMRTYQVSDINEAHSFADYQISRIITCILMVLVGFIYCNIRGYVDQMYWISVGVYLYKMVDGWADVYEGRLQQVDKMYLAGISQSFRSVLVFLVFTIALVISKDVGIASVAMAIAAGVSMFFLTIPLAMFESPKSRKWSTSSIIKLFKVCFPVFIALFLYSFIDNMPKFVMEGVLSYDNQLYFNVMYFPAQMILIVVQLIYKPLLVRLANVWADPSQHKKFDQVIMAMCGITVGVTVIMILIMNWIGIPIFNLLYGIDFEPYRGMFMIMLVAGGVTGLIDFLYQVITVLRRQKDVMRLYIITFGFAIFVPLLLINYTGLPGAVIGYLIVMCILFVLLFSEYIAIHSQYKANPEAAVAAASAGGSGDAAAGASVDGTGAASGAGAANGAAGTAGTSSDTDAAGEHPSAASVTAPASGVATVTGTATIPDGGVVGAASDGAPVSAASAENAGGATGAAGSTGGTAASTVATAGNHSRTAPAQAQYVRQPRPTQGGQGDAGQSVGKSQSSQARPSQPQPSVDRLNRMNNEELHRAGYIRIPEVGEQSHSSNRNNDFPDLGQDLDEPSMPANDDRAFLRDIPKISFDHAKQNDLNLAQPENRRRRDGSDGNNDDFAN